MAYRLKLTADQARQLNDKVVDMLLGDEDPGRIIDLLENAEIEERDD